MAELAVNPNTGEAVYFDGQTWQPAKIAVNPETRERVAFDGREWKPIGIEPARTPEDVGNIVRNVGKQTDANDEWRGRAASALQGATFGYADEAIAGLRSLTGEDYDTALAEERNVLQGAQEREPLLSGALEIAGGIAVPGLGFAKAASVANPLVRYGLALPAAGAVTGALTGFGVGEGGFENRAQTGLMGAGIGGVLAPAIPGILSLAGRGARGIGDALGMVSDDAAQIRGDRKVLQAIGRTGMDVGDADKALQDAARDGVDGYALVDIGKNTQRTLSAATRVGGEGAEIVDDFVANRLSGEPARIGGYFEDILGTTKNATTFLDDLTKAQSAAARPLYAASDDVAIPSDAMGDLFQNRTVMGALNKGRLMLENEGIIVPAITKDSIPATLPTRLWDAAKKNIDDLISAAQRKGANNEARALTMLKDRMVAALDDLNPNYAKARAAFAGPAALKDAADLGQQIFKTSPDDIAKALARLSPSETEAFRIGTLDAVRTVLAGPDGANKVKRLFGSPKLRDQLAAVLTPDDMAKLNKLLLGYEAAMRRSVRKVSGGSETAERMADDAEFQKQPLLIPRSVSDLVKMVGNKGAGYVQGYNEKIAKAVIEALTTVDPAAQRTLMDRLTDFAAKESARAGSPFRNPFTYGVGIGGVGAPAQLD